MADKKISDLTAGAALGDTDIFEIEQGGVSKKATGAQFKKLTPRFVNVALSDMATAIVAGVGIAAWWPPESGILVGAYTAVATQSTSGAVQVDMKDSGGTVFTTKPSIDASENTSLTGTAAVVDSPVTFSKGDKLTFDIVTAGTGAKGLQICFEYNAS